MCILSKFDYGKFGVSNLSFSRVIEEKPLGSAQPPPLLVKEGLMKENVRFAAFQNFYLSPPKFLEKSQI